jgi:hypothetical protein
MLGTLRHPTSSCRRATLPAPSTWPLPWRSRAVSRGTTLLTGGISQLDDVSRWRGRDCVLMVEALDVQQPGTHSLARMVKRGRRGPFRRFLDLPPPSATASDGAQHTRCRSGFDISFRTSHAYRQRSMSAILPLSSHSAQASMDGQSCHRHPGQAGQVDHLLGRQHRRVRLSPQRPSRRG